MEYEKKAINKVDEAEHIVRAEEMGRLIVNEFEPTQQNEMLEKIRHIIVEHRQVRIEEAEKSLEYLKETLQTLHGK